VQISSPIRIEMIRIMLNCIMMATDFGKAIPTVCRCGAVCFSVLKIMLVFRFYHVDYEKNVIVL
jgi:hypothetical protein